DEGRGIKLSADAPVHACTLETVRRFAFLLFRVALRAAVRAIDKLFERIVPDADLAEQIALALVVSASPEHTGLVQNVHVAPCVLVYKQGEHVLVGLPYTALDHIRSKIPNPHFFTSPCQYS